MSQRVGALCHSLLRLASLLVPAQERGEWLREWHAELYCSWVSGGPRRWPHLSAYFRCLGAMEDAFWLRIRRRDRGMLLQDIKYAIRSFAKSPGFTLVVVITLALGIGANTAIFTLVDAVLLRPLPVHEPSELADIWTTCRRGFRYCSSSYPDFLDYRDRSRSFVGMAAFASTEVSLHDGDARLVEATLATGNYFSMLGVGAAAGRLIGTSDDRGAIPTR